MSRAVESFDLFQERQYFQCCLRRWFRLRGRDLPWRRTRDPYAVLVSEFMLQQTQVATVISYYSGWLERFPDFSALARASESDVLHAWQGLGYYTRAGHLYAAAKFVQEKFDGALPADAARIAQLPGVGRYTAGAIASFAFNLPEPVVDVNVGRVLARLTNWQMPIETAASRAHLWRTATALLPGRGAREHNSALMDLGALVCLPRQPRCSECPVHSFCRAAEPSLLPIKRKRQATIHLTESHSLAQCGDRVLLEQSRERWRGMWILPPLLSAPARPPLLTLDFPFTHHRITLAVFSQPAPAQAIENQRWFLFPELPGLPVPSPHRRALAQLLPDEKVGRLARRA